MTTWTFRMFGICMNLNNFFFFLGTGIKPVRERERKEEDEIFRCPGGAPGEVLEWAQPPATLSIFCVSSVKSNFHSSPTPPSSSFIRIWNHPITSFPGIFGIFSENLNLAPIFFPQKIPQKIRKNRQNSAIEFSSRQLGFPLISKFFLIFFEKNLAPNFERFEISENGNAAVNWNFFL